MASLKIHVGPKGSKTWAAFGTYNDYLESNQKPLLVKPKAAGGEPIIETRPGYELPCIFMEEVMKMANIDIKGYAVIIVDSSQFLSKKQAMFLIHIVDDLGVPVVCYGQKNDANGNMYLGTKYIMEAADRTIEDIAVCWCNKAAQYTLALDEDGNFLSAEEISAMKNEIENIKMISVCRKHFFQKKIN